MSICFEMWPPAKDKIGCTQALMITRLPRCHRSSSWRAHTGSSGKAIGYVNGASKQSGSRWSMSRWRARPSAHGLFLQPCSPPASGPCRRPQRTVAAAQPTSGRRHHRSRQPPVKFNLNLLIYEAPRPSSIAGSGRQTHSAQQFWMSNHKPSELGQCPGRYARPCMSR